MYLERTLSLAPWLVDGANGRLYGSWKNGKVSWNAVASGYAMGATRVEEPETGYGDDFSVFRKKVKGNAGRA